ncbi:MAG: nucleoside triphosphate pyrophosphohydrolase [Bacteroidota bacterium]
MNNTEKLQAFDRLLRLVDELREKSPWSQEQTMRSLRPLVVEEAFELSEAVLADNRDAIKQELGDLLLHIVFYASIATEQQSFTITEVIQGLCDKLIHRHLPIYGQAEAADVHAAGKNWEQRKLQEKGNRSVLDGVPSSLPSLIKATRIQEKAGRVGSGWQRSEEVWPKVQETMQNFAEAVRQHSDSDDEPGQDGVQEAIGDLLFALAGYARLIAIDPDAALEETNQKFIQKFQVAEQAGPSNKRGSQCSPQA